MCGGTVARPPRATIDGGIRRPPFPAPTSQDRGPTGSKTTSLAPVGWDRRLEGPPVGGGVLPRQSSESRLSIRKVRDAAHAKQQEAWPFPACPERPRAWVRDRKRSERVSNEADFLGTSMTPCCLGAWFGHHPNNVSATSSRVSPACSTTSFKIALGSPPAPDREAKS